MIRHSRLEKTAIAQWLENQEAAALKIEEERTTFLLSLTRDQAFSIYLKLHSAVVFEEADKPSFLLRAMRQALRNKSIHVSS